MDSAVDKNAPGLTMQTVNTATQISNVRYQTFYDRDETASLLGYWRAQHPQEAESVYLTTHAGRFAYLISAIRLLGLRGSCLDVAGTSLTKTLLEDLTRLTSVTLTSDIDVQQTGWADHVGSAPYDLAIFSEVIEHLEADPAAALHEINRSLRIGGHLLLTTVNIASELGLYLLATGEAPYAMSNIFGTKRDRHQREYAPNELQRLVAAHGFDTWMTTVNVYRTADVKLAAWRWVSSHIHGAPSGLRGDTIVVLARKRHESRNARWLHPIYHESVAENRRDVVPDDVSELVHTGFPATLNSITPQ